MRVSTGVQSWGRQALGPSGNLPPSRSLRWQWQNECEYNAWCGNMLLLLFKSADKVLPYTARYSQPPAEISTTGLV